MRYEVELAGEARAVEVRRVGPRYEVRVGDGPWRSLAVARAGTAWRLEEAGEIRRIDVSVDGEAAFVRTSAGAWGGTVVDPRKHALQLGAGGGAGAVTSPMPGAVVRVLVAGGQAVHKGQVLVVVEAMKMENELRAPVDGVVERVAVQVGDAVESGALLVVVAAG